MKKLTALLLGTVIGIAFTADAFAESAIKNYWNSNDGKTGAYLGISGHKGAINDVEAGYNFNTVDSRWQLDDGEGAKIQLGYDWGKIRIDGRLGAISSSVESIDNAVLENGTSDDAALAYATLNLDLDLYRFELRNEIAVTPYVGGGAGYGGGWMTGKKASDTAGADSKRDAAGRGFAYTAEAGVLINITDWAGITLGYNYLHMSLGQSKDLSSSMGEFGVRFTY